MTVAALNWAFRQVVPPAPKVILLALADQAEELTGKVCYGPTNLDHIARKSSLPRRTLSRHIGALMRNGYVRRESNKDRGQPSHYWLCIDRDPADSLDEWSFTTKPDDDEREEVDDAEQHDDPQDIDRVGQNGLPPSDQEVDKTVMQNGPPPGPHGGPAVGHMDGPHESTNNQRTTTREVEQKKTNGFSKQAQDEDRACVVAERVNKSENATVFVIEGSKAWISWAAEMQRRTGRLFSLTCTGTVNGRKYHGWYFPTLFPPANKPTAPPDVLSDEDAQALTVT